MDGLAGQRVARPGRSALQPVCPRQVYLSAFDLLLPDPLLPDPLLPDPELPDPEPVVEPLDPDEVSDLEGLSLELSLPDPPPDPVPEPSEVPADLDAPPEELEEPRESFL